MNETIENLITRRSVKKYSDQRVEESLLQEILMAGTYAPNGAGKQSAVIVAVEDPETISLLAKLNNRVSGRDIDPFYGAKTVVVVLANKNVPTHVYDGSLVMGNLMNAAHALGVDSCWIHRAKEVFESEEGIALLKKWGLDENYEGIGNCILGYRSGVYPNPKPRKENFIIRVK